MAEMDDTAVASVELSGWGHYPVRHGRQRLGEDLERITDGVTLTRGLGRSYGDASLPAAAGNLVAGSPLADRILSFDRETGVLRAEAGLPLWRLNRLLLQHNWFTPVSPGTHFVTLGGMVAADVHGKMHHVDGCIGEHILALRLRTADGHIVECSDAVERDLFRATIGGMGLTGHILEVELRMKRIPSPWIYQENQVCGSLDELLVKLQEDGKRFPLTVSWSDFLLRGPAMGRGVVMSGRWAEPGEAPAAPPKFRSPITVPPVFPSWFLRQWMMTILNRANYLANQYRAAKGIIHPETFFYPLDTLLFWNRVYGRRGFTQYQCVLPTSDGYAGHHRLVEVLRRMKAPVFLSVVKDCGAEGKGMLSFPKPGVSYALDLPVDRRTQAIVDALNEVVIAEGGRVYLAKDAFTRAEHFRAMEPRLDAWLAIRRRWDPEGRLRSAQSVRLFGDQP